MTSMIEQIIAAMQQVGKERGFPAIPNYAQRHYAIAMMEAMREPTPEMLAAVDAQVVGCCNMTDKDARECWQTQIDAALKETP